MSVRSKPEDYVGNRYANLVVEGLFIAPGENVSRAACLCDCGNKSTPLLKDLKRGLTTSCGCRGRMRRTQSLTLHDMTGTQVYRAWVSMTQRCTNKRNSNYKDYGGRGITVDPTWRSFEEFYRCVGDPPKNHTLDRIDVNKGYEPGNVRWASRKVQSRNKRNNRMLTYKGKTMCVADWVDETGLSSSLIINRIEYLGGSEEKALATPAKLSTRRNKSSPTEVQERYV